MSREICVHSWPCSYYLEPEKRWVSGKLSLTTHSLRFAADKTGEALVSFPLSSVIEIKKEASHFVFSSITVLEKDHVKHWFSSLQPSRNVVFSIIEHFWREVLLSPAEVPLPATKGKQLTGLMACSQKRLEETARVLHHQGEQLDSITRGLEKMDSDLDVADRYWGASDIGVTSLPCTVIVGGQWPGAKLQFHMNKGYGSFHPMGKTGQEARSHTQGVLFCTAL